jgi:hypothetical protein
MVEKRKTSKKMEIYSLQNRGGHLWPERNVKNGREEEKTTKS